MPALDAGFISANAHPARCHRGHGPGCKPAVSGSTMWWAAVFDWLSGRMPRYRLENWAARWPKNGGAVIGMGSPSGQVECDGVVRDWMARHRASHALVRPDNAVFGVGLDEASALTLIEEANRILQSGSSRRTIRVIAGSLALRARSAWPGGKALATIRAACSTRPVEDRRAAAASGAFSNQVVTG